VHIVRDKVVDLIIGQISLLFACVDQLFYVVVLVIKCQARLSSGRSPVRERQLFSGGSWDGVVREAHKLEEYSTPTSTSADAT
jgi:hypothetical protein